MNSGSRVFGQFNRNRCMDELLDRNKSSQTQGFREKEPDFNGVRNVGRGSLPNCGCVGPHYQCNNEPEYHRQASQHSNNCCHSQREVPPHSMSDFWHNPCHRMIPHQQYSDYNGQRNFTNERNPGRRREKYNPPNKSNVELFNEDLYIQPGSCWEEQCKVMDKKMVISNQQTDLTFSNKIIQSFGECNFSEEINRSIELRKFHAPTPIQKGVITLITKSRADIMGHAQTGSGKTAAFLLPIIHRIQVIKQGQQAADAQHMPYAIIVEPTKELAEQLYTDASSFATNTGVRVARSYGDMPIGASKKRIAQGCDIFLATCGRLLHFVKDEFIRLGNLHFLVLDEADKLLSVPDFQMCVDEMKKCPEINPEHRTLMFSATFNSSVQKTAQHYLKDDYFFVRVGILNSAVSSIEQKFIEVSKHEKQNALLEILKSNSKPKARIDGKERIPLAKKTMVFVAHKRESDRLAIALLQEKYSVTNINSDRTLKQRMEAAAEFTRGAFDILVATDVASRGLNFPNVDLVINFDLPERLGEEDAYIHRIGRTGRAGNAGSSISFFDPSNPDDLEKAGYYVNVLRNVEKDVPEFLLKYANERVETQLPNLHAEGRSVGERRNAWGENDVVGATVSSSNGSSQRQNAIAQQFLSNQMRRNNIAHLQKQNRVSRNLEKRTTYYEDGDDW